MTLSPRRQTPTRRIFLDASAKTFSASVLSQHLDTVNSRNTFWTTSKRPITSSSVAMATRGLFNDPTVAYSGSSNVETRRFESTSVVEKTLTVDRLKCVYKDAVEPTVPA